MKKIISAFSIFTIAFLSINSSVLADSFTKENSGDEKIYSWNIGDSFWWTFSENDDYTRWTDEENSQDMLETALWKDLSIDMLDWTNSGQSFYVYDSIIDNSGDIHFVYSTTKDNETKAYYGLYNGNNFDKQEIANFPEAKIQMSITLSKAGLPFVTISTNPNYWKPKLLLSVKVRWVWRMLEISNSDIWFFSNSLDIEIEKSGLPVISFLSKKGSTTQTSLAIFRGWKFKIVNHSYSKTSDLEVSPNWDIFLTWEDWIYKLIENSHGRYFEKVFSLDKAFYADLEIQNDNNFYVAYIDADFFANIIKVKNIGSNNESIREITKLEASFAPIKLSITSWNVKLFYQEKAEDRFYEEAIDLNVYNNSSKEIETLYTWTVRQDFSAQVDNKWDFYVTWTFGGEHASWEVAGWTPAYREWEKEYRKWYDFEWRWVAVIKEKDSNSSKNIKQKPYFVTSNQKWNISYFSYETTGKFHTRYPKMIDLPKNIKANLDYKYLDSKGKNITWIWDFNSDSIDDILVLFKEGNSLKARIEIKSSKLKNIFETRIKWWKSSIEVDLMDINSFDISEIAVWKFDDNDSLDFAFVRKWDSKIYIANAKWEWFLVNSFENSYWIEEIKWIDSLDFDGDSIDEIVISWIHKDELSYAFWVIYTTAEKANLWFGKAQNIAGKKYSSLWITAWNFDWNSATKEIVITGNNIEGNWGIQMISIPYDDENPQIINSWLELPVSGLNHSRIVDNLSLNKDNIDDLVVLDTQNNKIYFYAWSETWEFKLIKQNFAFHPWKPCLWGSTWCLIDPNVLEFKDEIDFSQYDKINSISTPAYIK